MHFLMITGYSRSIALPQHVTLAGVPLKGPTALKAERCEGVKDKSEGDLLPSGPGGNGLPGGLVMHLLSRNPVMFTSTASHTSLLVS